MAAVKAMGFGAIARCGISANSDMLDCHILVLRYAATGCLWLDIRFDGNPESIFVTIIAIHRNSPEFHVNEPQHLEVKATKTKKCFEV